MQAFTSFPYLTLPDEKVEVTGWTFPDGKPLRDVAENWDPGRDLTLTCTVSLDPSEVRRICGLGDNDGLALLATWRSTGTTLRGCGASIPLPVTQGGKESFGMTMVAPAGEISGRLEVRTTLVLMQPAAGGGTLSAKHPGSVLWLRKDSTDLEGGRPTFPVCAVPFSDIPGWSPDALWVLEWDPATVDLFSPFSAEVRLYLNRDHPVFPAFGGADHRLSASDDAIRSVLFHDLAEDLVQAAISRSEEIEGEDFPGGSVGRVISSLVSASFSGMRPSLVAAKRRTNPGWFSTRMQASTKLFSTVRNA